MASTRPVNRSAARSASPVGVCSPTQLHAAHAGRIPSGNSAVRTASATTIRLTEELRLELGAGPLLVAVPLLGPGIRVHVVAPFPPVPPPVLRGELQPAQP